jgi:hypothetical protein
MIDVFHKRIRTIMSILQTLLLQITQKGTNLTLKQQFFETTDSLNL